MSNYGTAAGVALIARKYANIGQGFDATTTPTADEVATWLTQVCAMLDAGLAEARFSVPVTDSGVTPMLDMFVNRQVANMVEAMHLSKRSGPIAGQNARGVTVSDVLAGLPGQVMAFVKLNAGGLEAMGASRSTTQTYMGSVPMTRADAYSDDVDVWENPY